MVHADLQHLPSEKPHSNQRLCRLQGYYTCRTPVTTATENDRLLLTACDFKEHFVIEAQSELRHSRQDHFQLDGSNNFTPQDAAIGAHLRVKEE